MIAAETLAVTLTDAQTADAQPQQTMAPDILQADYAELYINALKQCGYMKQRLEAGSFLAVSLPSYPVLEEEQLERIRSYFGGNGCEVIFRSFAQLEQEGLVLRNGDDWVMPGGVYVYVNLVDAQTPGQTGLVCETACSSLIKSRQNMTFLLYDGIWKMKDQEQQWQGDKNYIPVRKLLGDFDTDGQVSLDDTMHILRVALKTGALPEGSFVSDMDMDDDGQLTLEDASAALRCALKIQKPYYYETLWENQIYADVVEAEMDGIRCFDSSEEAVQYLQSQNLTEAVKQIEALNDTQLSGKKIAVAALRTNAADKTHLQEETAFHMGSRTLNTTLTEQTAVRDEQPRTYVRMYLIDGDVRMEVQKVTVKTNQEVVLHTADAGEAQPENSTVICSTYDAYQKQVQENNLPALDGVNQAFFKQKALVYQYAQKTMAGDAVKNKLHVSGSRIEVENALTKASAKTEMKNIWYLIEVPQKLIKQGNLEVQVTKSSDR